MKKIIFFICFLFFNYNLCYSQNNEQENIEIESEKIINNETSQNDKIIENVENNILSKKKISNYEEEFYSAFNSFMFSDNALNVIKKALILYKDKSLVKKNNEEETVDILNNENVEENFTSDIGNIYLKAILYISESFWSIWINDKKVSNFNNLDKDNEYYIKKINNSEATIVLTVNKAKWNYINSNNLIAPDRYNFNKNNNKIEFKIKLHPNQTFVSSKDLIVDGKYKEESEKLIDSIEDEEDLNLFLDGEFDFDNLE